MSLSVHLCLLSLAVEISSESEPEELDDLEDIEDIKVDDEELNDLDRLIATTKSNRPLLLAPQRRSSFPRSPHPPKNPKPKLSNGSRSSTTSSVTSSSKTK